MAMFGSSWKDDPTPEERYEEITGYKFDGDNKKLKSHIDRLLDELPSLSSMSEIKQLQELRMKMDGIS